MSLALLVCQTQFCLQYYLFVGQEYQTVVLSTTEALNQDGSSLDATKSFCDPYVFNTVITRAKSLVIAVGNPFILLNLEKFFVREYGEEHNAYCWSTYLDLCMKNESFHVDSRLALTEENKSKLLGEIRAKIADSQQKKMEKLEKENKELKQQVQELQLNIAHLEQQLEKVRMLQNTPEVPKTGKHHII